MNKKNIAIAEKRQGKTARSVRTVPAEVSSKMLAVANNEEDRHESVYHLVDIIDYLFDAVIN